MGVVITVNSEWTPYVDIIGALNAGSRTGKGYARFAAADLAAAKTLASTPTAGAVIQADTAHAWIYVKNGGIRVRTDGTDPTATEGQYFPDGSFIQVEDQRQFLLAFRMIAASGEAPEVTITYFS